MILSIKRKTQMKQKIWIRQNRTEENYITVKFTKDNKNCFPNFIFTIF